MALYLLQDIQYFKEDNPVAAMILLIGLGAVIIVFFVGNLIRNGVNSGRVRRGTGSASRRFPVFALHRIGRSYGLNGEQLKTLEYVLKTNGVTDPDRVVNNPALLDKQFKRTYKQIERSSGSDEEAQQKLALLFSVRNTIEVAQNTSADTTQQLSANMEAVLTVNQESYPVKVISTKGETVLVNCPRNSIGSLIRFPKGTRLNLSFFSKTNKGFSFNCQLIDTTDTTFGPALQLAPVEKPKAMTQRRFRRRQAIIPCAYNLIRIEEGKGKKPGKMVVEPRRIEGEATDISIGGCSVKAGTPASPGARLKIEFNCPQSPVPIAVLGQVLRINRSGLAKTIMHIKFLKVPRKAMNVINSLVFEYSDD
ncbi:MAG: PilZ domain-containing protein [Treponema sp.]|jgi:hypothetical protein|nr:PilZ domain-containing protein [Treponema sp.]